MDISEQKRVRIRLESQLKKLFHLSLIYLHFDFGTTKIKYSVDRNLHILSIFLREIKAFRTGKPEARKRNTILSKMSMI